MCVSKIKKYCTLSVALAIAEVTMDSLIPIRRSTYMGNKYLAKRNHKKIKFIYKKIKKEEPWL